MSNTFSYKLEGKTIKRIELGANGEVQKETDVAVYDEERKAVIIDRLPLRRYKREIETWLAEQEIKANLQRKDLPLDPLNSEIPEKRPKADPRMGDATPAIVEWYKKYKPNEFKTRYGVHDETYTGNVTVIESQYVTNVMGDQELVGNPKQTFKVKDALVSDRKTHLSYTPEECGLNNGQQDDEE